MQTSTQRTRLAIGWLAAVALLHGCATAPTFSLPRYQPAAERYVNLQPSAAKNVYLAPIIARLDPRNEQSLAPDFSVSNYLTDAMEQELQAAGITPGRAPFEVGPTLAEAEAAIIERADQPVDAVYVTGEVLWFGPVDMFSGFRSGMDAISRTFQTRITVDVRVYSAKGETLFAKRGFCTLLDSIMGGGQMGSHPWATASTEKSQTSQTVTQMALRQIIADPAFEKALE